MARFAAGEFPLGELDARLKEAVQADGRDTLAQACEYLGLVVRELSGDAAWKADFAKLKKLMKAKGGRAAIAELERMFGAPSVADLGGDAADPSKSRPRGTSCRKACGEYHTGEALATPGKKKSNFARPRLSNFAHSKSLTLRVGQHLRFGGLRKRRGYGIIFPS